MMLSGQTDPSLVPQQPNPNPLAPRPMASGMMMPGQTDNSLTPIAGGAPGAPQQPADPYSQLEQVTSPGGALYKQDPVRALKLNDEIKSKRSLESWDKINRAITEGKISKEQTIEAAAKMEPLIRATVPLTQAYEQLRAKGVDHNTAVAQIQPMYEQTVAAIASMPGFEGAAKSAPRVFNPAISYAAADTFKALEAQKLSAAKEEAKLGELTRSGSITPKGELIFTNKKGEQFVDGQPYHGRAVKPSAKGGGVSGNATLEGSSSGGVKGQKLTESDRNDAREYLSNFLAYYGKQPSGIGRNKGMTPDQIATFSGVTKMARDAGMTLPQLFAAGSDIKANASTMVKQKNLIANTAVNAEQARKDINIMRQQVARLGNGTIPIWNSAINRLKKGLGAPEPGTAEFAAYESMIEYTKVVSGQTTGAAPTDSAMKESAKQLSITGDNPVQIEDKFKMMEKLMAAKEESQQAEYNNMLKFIGKGVAPAAASTPPAATPANSKIPAGVQTGTYHGTPAYTRDGKTFFRQDNGKRID
jgi:hypothetical protein